MPVEQLAGIYDVHRLSQSTSVYGVLGDPARYSWGPWLHNRAFRRLSHDGVYLPFTTSHPEAVLEMLQRFNEDITALQRAIRWGEGEVLEALFRRTRKIRSGVIEAHQAGTFDTREREKFGPEERAPETEDPRSE